MTRSTRKRSGAENETRGGSFTHSSILALPKAASPPPSLPAGLTPVPRGTAPGPESPAAVRADPISLMALQCCLLWLRPQAPEASGDERSRLPHRPRSRPCRETCYRASPLLPFPASGRHGTSFPSPWILPSPGWLLPQPPPFSDIPSSQKGWWKLRLFISRT